MNLTKVRKTKGVSDEPLIRLSPARFHYNSVMSKLAKLHRYNYVEYQFDSEERVVAFKFYIEKVSPDCFKLTENKPNNHRSSIGGSLQHLNWITKTAQSKDPTLRSFEVEKYGEQWIIRLRPMFDNSYYRSDLNNIPKDSKGIYRYVHASNGKDEIMYIGKGNIVNRFNDFRSEWIFDKIEFSIIENDDDQFFWEDYWIDLFKERNNGKLPYYNRISGNKL